MTNFEMLKACQTEEQFYRQFSERLNRLCRQRTTEDWKKYCLSDEYRYIGGCKKCMIDYLKEEYVE